MLEMALVILGVLLLADIDFVVAHRKEGALQMVHRLKGVEVGELLHEIDVPVGQIFPVLGRNYYR